MFGKLRVRGDALAETPTHLTSCILVCELYGKIRETRPGRMQMVKCVSKMCNSQIGQKLFYFYEVNSEYPSVTISSLLCVKKALEYVLSW